MTKIKSSIQKPCNAGWGNMQPVPNGRFCTICSQNVVDFTEKTDQEIFDFFSNYKKNDLCCRIYDEQLPTFSLNENVYKFPKLLKRAAAVALLGISMGGMPVLLHGQSTISPEIIDKKQLPTQERVIVVEVPAEYQTIEIQKLVSPAKIVVDSIPAEYATIQTRRSIHVGGFSSYKEFSCILPNLAKPVP